MGTWPFGEKHQLVKSPRAGNKMHEGLICQIFHWPRSCLCQLSGIGRKYQGACLCPQLFLSFTNSSPILQCSVFPVFSPTCQLHIISSSCHLVFLCGPPLWSPQVHPPHLFRKFSLQHHSLGCAVCTVSCLLSLLD